VPKRANIHLLGNKPYDVLPAYVQAFDVGLIPYILNDWTRSVDPLKLLEYLASGIPVVTTTIPEVMKYASAIHIGRDTQTFVKAVAQALNEPASARADRQAVARRHTWAKRADRLMEIISQVVAEKAP
jgi:glycosyltransferase involved in cell wall biosynthesis